jgi:hypothetical protein
MSNGKVWQRFQTPDGEERFFTGIRRVWIGYTYRCAKDGISRRPERVDDIDRIDNPTWEAADTLVDQRNAKNRADEKYQRSSSPTIRSAVKALEPLCKGLHYFEIRALIEILTEKAFKQTRRK